MNQVIVSHCYYCGRPVNPQEDDFCPHCHYPASPAKEEAYLTAALASLQQAMAYGGAQLKVVDLHQRYQSRLRTLQKLSASRTAPASATENALEGAAATSVRVTSVVYQMPSPVPTEAAAPPVLATPSEPRRVFSWRSFFADQAINIVASLGAFLLLVGTLSFVATTPNLLLAFLVVFVVHAVFGITGIITRRFAAFRIVASIYTIIFALLVPLVGFSAYRLVSGNGLMLSVSALIAISASYAAIVYLILALFQRYAPFAYPAMAALAVADLALASVLNLEYWWWPSMLMILALLSLVSVARSPRLSRTFDGNRAILRQPVRLFMYVFVTLGTAGIVLVTLYSIVVDSFSQYHDAEVGYALLCLSLLRFVWSIGHFYLARRSRGLITLAFLFLVCVLAFCYALHLNVTGYALALTLVAILYAAISRFAVQLLRPFGALEVQLDWIALALVLLVPFLTSPFLSLPVAQLFTSTTGSQANWQMYAEVGAISAGMLLTLAIAFKRVGFSAVPRQSGWRWLVLAGTFLFTCAYSLVILTLHLNPLWCFLGVSIALMVGAVLARQRRDGKWADPLDVSALYSILITLGLSLNVSLEISGRLLFFFAASTYAILLYQRRSSWLFVPTIFAASALLLPTNSFWVLVLLTPALATLAVAARRFAGNAWAAPLAILALQAGIMTGITGFTQVHFEATAIVLLVFAIIAYVIGVLEQTVLPMWIMPFFAMWSLIVSTVFLDEPFRPPLVALVAAALGIVVTLYRRTDHPRLILSTLPLYATAFLASVLTAFWPHSNAAQAMIVAYSMLGFTAIALVILLVEGIPELLVFPAGYAAGAIWLWYPRPDFPSLVIAYTGLCVLVFATQFIWRILPHRQGWLPATALHEVLGIGGQAMVVAVILCQGRLAGSEGIAAQVGAGALCTLAALIFFLGLLRPYTVAFSLPEQVDMHVRLQRIQMAKEVRHQCYYIVGLLLSLVVSWELLAWQVTRLDVLLLAPASYLTIIAPFLMRDSVLRERRVLGQITAVAGACLLLLPELWFSFSDGNFLPTAILLGEALALLILGMVARVRIFVLGSAGLVIVATLRALFLETPPALTLMLTGVTLLAISTALILARHRLQIAWKQWD